MSDMKKIKSKLVTIVTDNVRPVGIVGNKNLLARVLQEGSGKAAS
jgi:signal-transduction protein with cAMP-binding, CBS, and nucleotidyltransferase domain